MVLWPVACRGMRLLPGLCELDIRKSFPRDLGDAQVPEELRGVSRGQTSAKCEKKASEIRVRGCLRLAAFQHRYAAGLSTGWSALSAVAVCLRQLPARR